MEIFCNVNDFNNVFINELQTHQITDGTRKRIKPGSLIKSEVITIVICFHLMRYRDFKHYYLFYVYEHVQGDFPGLVSYNRFVELMQKALLPLAVYCKFQFNCIPLFQLKRNAFYKYILKRFMLISCRMNKTYSSFSWSL